MDSEEKNRNKNVKIKKIYARNTIVKEIDNLGAQSFIAENHRQGKTSDEIKKISLGLFTIRNDELVGVIQFCTPRTSAKQRKYTGELLRLSFKTGVTVVGGASKLIKFYINNYSPDDFFTYQDTTGKNTDVYEKAGMCFVGQDKKKEYLIAPGKTLATAQREKKEVLSLAYAVKYGPDRILGTKLGEIFHPATHPTKPNKRKSNREIFVEDLGWHIETTSGDKVYEWFNPDKTYYTYKITATDSDKYYYGVSHIKKGNASIDDCLNDGYYGSGGSKFSNWKEKHKKSIKKTVIKTFDKRQNAYNNEKENIGDLWKTDPLCLNAQAGGNQDTRNTAWNKPKFSIKECPIHGKTKHQGNSCAKCSMNKSFSKKRCEVHGMTKHIGDACSKCFSQKSMSYKICPIHGETKHKSDCCTKCKNQKVVTLKICPVHGETKYQGNTCSVCATERQISIQVCPIHGETKFRGSKCHKCSVGDSFVIKVCPIHGKAPHQKDSCKKCVAQKIVNMRVCPIHGKTKHQGERCAKCAARKNISIKECKIHGKTKHRGNTCTNCANSKSIAQKECVIHGLCTHTGDTCKKCLAHKNNHNAGKHLKNNPNCPICIGSLKKV